MYIVECSTSNVYIGEANLHFELESLKTTNIVKLSPQICLAQMETHRSFNLSFLNRKWSESS